MARMTIAQLREREVDRLAHYHAEEPSEDDYRVACKLMNSFYRLCGLADRNLYRANCEYTCNTERTKREEAREYAWYRRLSAKFKEFAGLELFYTGHMPSIGTRNPENGGVCEKITRWFYQ